jgi:hypothetical protein
MVCMFFVFSAIVELTLVNYLHNKRKIILGKNKERKERLNKFDTNQNLSERQFPRSKGSNGEIFVPVVPWNERNNNYQLDHKILSNNSSIKDPPDRALQIDLAFRFIYPLCFVIYLAVFWPLLLTRNML